MPDGTRQRRLIASIAKRRWYAPHRARRFIRRFGLTERKLGLHDYTVSTRLRKWRPSFLLVRFARVVAGMHILWYYRQLRPRSQKTVAARNVPRGTKPQSQYWYYSSYGHYSLPCRVTFSLPRRIQATQKGPCGWRSAFAIYCGAAQGRIESRTILSIMSQTNILFGRCPTCNTKLQVKSRSTAKEVTCPKCNSQVSVNLPESGDLEAPRVDLSRGSVYQPKGKLSRSTKSRRRRIVVVAALCIAVTAILGAIPAFWSIQQAKYRDQCAKNLWLISTALDNMQSTMGRIDDIRDKSGKPLLSWRVRALPFMEETVLYQQFKRDEPWDSPDNKQLLERMPNPFRCCAASSSETVTPFQLITGPNTLFVGNAGSRLNNDSIADGANATILLVEASHKVPWTKPEDISWTPGNAMPALSQAHGSASLAVFADGTVRTIPGDTDERTITGLITPRGGESIALDRFPINQAVAEARRHLEDFMQKALGRETPREESHEQELVGKWEMADGSDFVIEFTRDGKMRLMDKAGDRKITLQDGEDLSYRFVSERDVQAEDFLFSTEIVNDKLTVADKGPVTLLISAGGNGVMFPGSEQSPLTFVRKSSPSNVNAAEATAGIDDVRNTILQGTWKLEEVKWAEMNSVTTIVVSSQSYLVINGNEMTEQYFEDQGKLNETRYSFTLDWSKQPPVYTRTELTGTNQGKSSSGILSIENDTLRLSSKRTGLPADFELAQGTEVKDKYVYVYTRHKR